MEASRQVAIKVLQKANNCLYLSDYIKWYKELFIEEYKIFSYLEIKIIISSAMKLAYRYMYANDYIFSDWIDYNQVDNDMLSTWISKILFENIDLEIDRYYN